MSASARVAFAASCAESLFELYCVYARRTTSGHPKALREALDDLWRHVSGTPIPGNRLGQLRRDCEQVTPDTMTETSPFVSGALNAVNATLAALDCAESAAVDKCSEGSTLVIDTLYLALAGHLDENDPDLWTKTAAHPAMARELAFQEDALSFLQAGGKPAELERRSRARSKILADDVSRLVFAA
jgi:hypothetical protein